MSPVAIVINIPITVNRHPVLNWFDGSKGEKISMTTRAHSRVGSNVHVVSKILSQTLVDNSAFPILTVTSWLLHQSSAKVRTSSGI